MRIIFTDGPEVLTLENGQEVRCNEPAEVPDHIAVGLINQKTFEEVKTAPVAQAEE